MLAFYLQKLVYSYFKKRIMKVIVFVLCAHSVESHGDDMWHQMKQSMCISVCWMFFYVTWSSWITTTSSHKKKKKLQKTYCCIVGWKKQFNDWIYKSIFLTTGGLFVLRFHKNIFKGWPLSAFSKSWSVRKYYFVFPLK